jgi:hypothetical protein
MNVVFGNECVFFEPQRHSGVNSETQRFFINNIRKAVRSIII